MRTVWKLLMLAPMVLALVVFALMLLLAVGPARAGAMLRAMSFGLEVALP